MSTFELYLQAIKVLHWHGFDDEYYREAKSKSMGLCVYHRRR